MSLNASVLGFSLEFTNKSHTVNMNYGFYYSDIDLTAS